MTRKTIQWYLILLAISSFFACSSTKKTKTVDCAHFAKVLDYANVEGCGFVLENEKGDRVIPLSVTASNNSFRFDANQRLSIDYVYATGINLCELNLKSIDITCVRVLPDLPTDCSDVDAPTPQWMQQSIKTFSPKIIEKIPTATDILYLYHCNTMKILLDCKGNKICQMSDNQKNTCSRFPTVSGKIIYQAETQAQ